MDKKRSIKFGPERLSKSEAISLFESGAALARQLGIKRAAVSNWSDTKPIPLVWELKLRYEICPECFEGARQAG